LTNILGLIPARGGSKSIPRKNLVPLAGRPLLSYTCDAALESRALNRVVMSTDDPEIAAVGRKCGVETPFERPRELSADVTPSLDVARHAVTWLETHEHWRADVVVLLQPTSPLRRARHIDEAIAQLDSAGADSVVSVVPVPHRFSPYTVMELDGGRLRAFWKEPTSFDRFRRQDLPVLYARNGPALLVSRASVIFDHESFYGPLTVPYFMSEEESVDINPPLDLRIAECLLGDRNPEPSRQL
jgi:CMP-N-acetylneuraminic acid synthetase